MPGLSGMSRFRSSLWVTYLVALLTLRGVISIHLRRGSVNSRWSSWHLGDTYVINLRHRRDRWDLVCEQFADRGLTPIRIEAVAGKDLIENESDQDGGIRESVAQSGQAPQFGYAEWGSYFRDFTENNVPRHTKVRPSAIDPGTVQLRYNTSWRAKYDRDIDSLSGLELSPGEVGCIMSHVGVWRSLAKHTSSDSTSLACIFEDDARFTKDWELFPTVAMEAPQDLDVLYLSYRDIDPADDVRFSDHLFVPRALLYTQAYCLTFQGVQKLLQLLPVNAPLDQWLGQNFGSLVVLAASPQLVDQNPRVGGLGDSNIEHTSYG